MKTTNIDSYFHNIPEKYIKEICNPLFKNFPLSYFSYLKIFTDNSRLVITSNPEFIKWIYTNDYSVASSFIKNINGGFYLEARIPKLPNRIDQNKEDLQHQGAYNLFDIDAPNGMTIVEQNNTYCEIFDFAASTRQPVSQDFFTSNINIFYHFIRYFRDQASDIIASLDKQRITISSKIKHKKIVIQPPVNKKLESAREDFFNETLLETCPVNEHIYLSKSEIKCLLQIIRGRTAREASQALKISHKTVEYYIQIVKDKLQCYSKSQLIDKLFEVDLIDTTYLKWLINKDKAR